MDSLAFAIKTNLVNSVAAEKYAKLCDIGCVATDMPFFLIPQLVDADAVLDRYAKFMKGVSSFSVSTKVAHSQILGEGTANITLAKPNLTSFSASWNNFRYSFFQDSRHLVEIDRTAKRYREWPSFSTFVTPPNEVTSLGHYTFPRLLLLTDFRQISNRLSKRLVKGLPGARIQTVNLSYETQGGPASLEVAIDELGRPVRTTEIMIVEGSRVVIKMSYSNWSAGKKYPASTFAGELEPGYVAHALGLESVPIQSNEKFVFQNWVKSGRSGTIQSVLLNKKHILVAVRGGCEYSERLLRLLEENSAQIQGQGASIGVLSLDGASIKTKFPVFVDPKGRGIANLRIAGTPTMFSVSASGITKQVWFPVISDQPSVLLKEIIASLK